MKSRRSRGEIIALIKTTMPWEHVSVEMLPPDAVETFRRRNEALDLYMNGRSIPEIKRITKIGGNYLRRIIERCLMVAPDGQPFGYRALLPNFPIKAYSRTKSLNTRPRGAGLAGALGTLFEMYQDLKDFLYSKILKRKSAKTEPESINEFSIRTKDVHYEFIKFLERHNHPPSEWPFNVKYRGLRTISDFVKETRLQNFNRAVQIIGNSAAIAHIPIGNGQSLIRLLGLMDGIEIDSHTYDADFVLSVPNSAGLNSFFEMKRLHVLVAVEISSTAVLWYHVVYGDDATAEDLLALIREMLGSERPLPLQVIPDIKLKNGAGFPADLFPCLKQALPSVIRFDNALINLSSKVNSTLRKQLGCALDYGLPGHFERRPTVENTFGRFTEDLCKRFPSTTGAGPDDGRAKNPGEEARKHMMESSALEQLTYSYFANHNAEPSEGLGFLSPLQALEQMIAARNEHFIPRYPPLNMQQSIGTASVRENRRVSADLKKGLRPHINLDGARYSSERLKQMTALVGKTIIVEINESDMRVVHGYIETGEPIGQLTVQGAWSKQPHTRKTRKTINSLKHKKVISYVEGECIVDTYHKYLLLKLRGAKQAGKQNRGTASKLDRLQHEISQSPSELPSGDEATSTLIPPHDDTPLPQRAWMVSAADLNLLELIKKL